MATGGHGGRANDQASHAAGKWKMNNLLPELSVASCMCDRLRVEGIKFSLSWNRFDHLCFRIGNGEFQPSFSSIKIWINGICIGLHELHCGAFLKTDTVNLMKSCAKVTVQP